MSDEQQAREYERDAMDDKDMPMPERYEDRRGQ